mgnify:CR=1 FL=1
MLREHRCYVVVSEVVVIVGLPLGCGTTSLRPRSGRRGLQRALALAGSHLFYRVYSGRSRLAHRPLGSSRALRTQSACLSRPPGSSTGSTTWSCHGSLCLGLRTTQLLQLLAKFVVRPAKIPTQLLVVRAVEATVASRACALSEARDKQHWWVSHTN